MPRSTDRQGLGVSERGRSRLAVAPAAAQPNPAAIKAFNRRRAQREFLGRRFGARSVVWIIAMLFGKKLRMARLAASLASCIGLLSAAGQAQSTSDDLARRHFESGAAYLEESDYDNALKAFEKAYELSKRPEILLNIATV